MSLSILDLPTEVIGHIFNFVSHKKDRRNLALICKRFKKIVRQQSKKHNHIDVSDEMGSPFSIFEQSDEFPFQKLCLRCNEYYGDIEDYRAIWARHGAEITQITLEYRLDRLVSDGSDFEELFPNLKSFTYEIPWNRMGEERLVKVDNVYFSEMIEDLNLPLFKASFQEMKLISQLFPGLKHLKIQMFIEEEQTDSEVEECKEVLEDLLPKLKRIEISFTAIQNSLHLLRAFDGLMDEKLNFGSFRLSLTNKNIDILKDFFGVTRHIKSLEIYLKKINYNSNSNALIALIDKNAQIDRLIIHDFDVAWNAGLGGIVLGFVNAPGVKEIEFHGFIGVPFNLLRFTPEALMKIKKIELKGLPREKVSNIPLFRNLRNLKIGSFVVGDEELDFIVNNFPLLERVEFSESYLFATNGRCLTNLKNLQALYFNGLTRLGDAFFDFDSVLPNVKTLLVFGMEKISVAGVKSIVKYCPNIQSMFLKLHDEIAEECIDLIVQKLFYIEEITLKLNSTKLKSYLMEKYPKINVK